MLKCIGCGSTIQFDDPKKPGFIKKEVFEKTDLEQVLCYRCFQIKNYNKYDVAPISEEVYYNIIKKITMSKNLFVYVCDTFDLMSVDPTIIDMLNNRDTIYVFNRFDLLPKSVNPGKIKANIRKYLHKFNAKYKDILLVSAKNKFNVDELIEKIESLRNGRNVYLIGHSNVGKSSLLNAMIRSIGLLEKDIITVSNNLATTISLIEVPYFQDGKKMIDTPGLVKQDNMLYNILQSDLKSFQVTKEVRQRVYQMSALNALNISNVLSLTVENDTNVIVYVSNNLEIIKTKTFKENFSNKNLFKIDTEFNQYEDIDLDIKKGESLLLSGLGFIIFKNDTKLHLKKLAKLGMRVEHDIFD